MFKASEHLFAAARPLGSFVAAGIAAISRKARACFAGVLLLACSSHHEPESCPSIGVSRVPLISGAAGSSLLRLSGPQRSAVIKLQSASGQGLCTGTLVAKQWVLTAAHCGDLLQGDVTAYARDAGCDVSLGGLRRRVRHPTLDLLLLELGEVTSVAPVRLNLSAVEVQDLGHAFVELSGYGRTEAGVAGDLRFLVAEVVSFDQTTMSVDAPERSGACFGDSGGPLLQRCEGGAPCILGVLSRGSATCGGRDSYVRVDAARGWLEEHVSVAAPNVPGPCEDVTPRGMCLGARAVYCNDGALVSDRCGSAESCSWSDEAAGYRCGDPVGDCGNVTQLGACQDEVALSCDAGLLIADDCRSSNRRCLRMPPTAIAQCWGN